MKDYNYNDDFLAPHNPNGDGYTEESEPEEINYDNLDPQEEEEEFKKHRKDLTTELFKLIETSFKP